VTRWQDDDGRVLDPLLSLANVIRHFCLRADTHAHFVDGNGVECLVKLMQANDR
jgi:hypothetical protein